MCSYLNHSDRASNLLDFVTGDSSFGMSWTGEGNTTVESFSDFPEFKPASPCRSVPITIAPTHFYTGEADFTNVLQQLEDFFEDVAAQTTNISVRYFETDQCFLVDQVVPSGIDRTDSVSIFWDASKQQHVIEVRRIGGKALFMTADDRLVYVNIHDELYELFVGEEPVCLRQNVVQNIFANLPVSGAAINPEWPPEYLEMLFGRDFGR